MAPVTIPALAGAVLAAIVVGFFLTVAGLVVGAGSLVARFHRARGVERQQLRYDLDRVVVAPGSGRRLPRPPRRRRRPGSSVAVGSLVLLVV